MVSCFQPKFRTEDWIDGDVRRKCVSEDDPCTLHKLNWIFRDQML